MKRVTSFLLFGFLLLSVESIAQEESASQSEQSTTKKEQIASTDNLEMPHMTSPDARLLEDFKNFRQKLIEKEKQLQAKQQELDAKEKALNEEIQKLKTIRDEITKVNDQKKKESEAKVAKLVETIENMSPKSASTLLSTLGKDLSVDVMAKLSTLKLAKIMAKMEPDVASVLSEMMAGRQPSRKLAGGEKR